MATLRELIIKVSANSSSFQTEISRASRMGSDYYKTMEQGGKRSAVATRQSQQALRELNAQLISVKSAAAGMAGAFAGAFASGQLINYADTWNQLNGRLRLASTSTEDFSTAQRTLMEISQHTGISLESNSNLYSRIASSLRDAGYASKDVAAVTETVATSLKLSGASTEEAGSVITQLSQALGSGVLHGEEFNAIMENGGRLAKLLADGLGTTVGGLRNMAQNGELTTDKIVPLLTNVEQLRKEFETLPASISGSGQKVKNSFMAWVGAENDAVGASSALAGALDGLASNIDTVANAAGVLVGVGVAKYLGGVVSSTATATGQLINTRKSTISLADAQVYASTQAQRKAIATAEAARSDYALAVAEANVAKNTNASVLATANLTAKRSEMIAANANLVLSNRAVLASQESLNKATSTIGLAKSGFSGLLSIVGGWPGAIMAIGAAWLYAYERSEEARKSALAYGEELAKAKPTSGISLAGGDNTNEINKTAVSMRYQAEEISSLNSQIAELTQQHYNASQAMKNSEAGSWSYNNAQESLVDINQQLIVAEKRRAEISDQLNVTTDKHSILIRQNAAAQTVYYNNLVSMTGQGALFKQALDEINQSMITNSQIARSPLRLPQAQVSDKDQTTLIQKQQQAELAGLTGLERVRKQAQIDLQRMGRTGAENATYAEQYTQALEKEYENSQRVAQSRKDSTAATNAQNKAENSAAKTAEQYSRKIADLSIATEVQRVRATQGEKAADLFAASHENGAKWTDEQRKSLEASSAELARWTQRADEAVRKQHEMSDALKDLRDATRKYQDDASQISETRGMGDRGREQYNERQQVERVFDKTDKGSEAIAARQAALDALDKKYQESAAAEADWLAGSQKGLSNWMDTASNYADQTASLVSNTMSGFVDTLSGALSGNKTSWEDWSKSVLQSMQKVILNAMLVNSIKGLGGAGFMSMFSGGASGASGASGDAGGLFSSGAFDNLTLNAKGGAYASEGLSAHSNTIVNTPTYFAFAKGAGLMGEAGPEAIMPLTRSADGSLGVRMVGGESGSGVGGDTIIHQHFTISGNGDAALRQAMQEAAHKGATDGAKKARQEMLQDFQTRGQGRRLLGV